MEKSNEKVWKLPNLTHCNLLPVITNCLPLNIILEKRLLKIYVVFPILYQTVIIKMYL